ncbi:hypothetical protein B0F90DRAFT_1622303 [Multifurca ochricompacta]|uniref:non-specific serine/threonine protein kinase n=1 Tax=Multifurca ochricompacta TaxID=376703 RepID=A0AAD4MBT2_9AGAM|nr:hypothetical protein B0F90DRAFT_1622303 [Multifurca ochricompacta]
MSEPLPPRRQPPSPLVFSPETALPPIVAPSVSSSSAHGSGSNTVSMPFVRRHVTRRLKAAKQECDKELQRVTNSITSFFEERLREGELERPEREQRERDQQSPDPDPLREAFVLQQAEPKSASAFLSDDASSDGGYEAELEGNHSRQRASLDGTCRSPPTLTHSSSSPGLLAASLSSSSPGLIRRQATISWDKVSAPSPITASNSAAGSSQAGEATTSPRKQSTAANTSWSSGGIASRRLSRSIHIPIRPTRSGHSSRSTSRSRSPLPPNNHSSFTESLSNPASSNNRRSSRILIDNPVDPIMTNLYELISVATDVMDMTVAQLTSQPKSVETIVQRVQTIGKAWDDHPDWHGRNWYVQVLLAVASLSRVVEWWEAEKQFWNFDDNDDEQEEALLFVMKPADDHIPPPAPTPRLAPEEDPRLRLSRPTSQGKRTRDEVQSLSLPPPDPSRAPLSKPSDTAESARVLATERLRLQAETAQNRNIVMELNLDGDHIVWLNYAWEVVVGTDPDELQGTRISKLLAPQDSSVFQVATQTLREDDSHTVEVRFYLRVEPYDERDDPNSALYQLMDGKGMTMADREEGTLSHTMWVIKPCGPPEYLQPSIHVEDDGDAQPPSASALVERSLGNHVEEPPTPLPFARPINVTPILCRICENNIPQWYFEKHNETCSETHRLEAEIGECNESIAELRNAIRDISTTLDRSSPVTTPEYRGLPILSPSSSPISSSPLQLFRINKMQRFGVKKMQRRLLEQLDDTLQVALEISVPALKEDEAKEPIERQRLLSPGSERKIMQIRNWLKPTTSDNGLGQLIQDAERVMRQKIDTVVRLQNTIRYSEKVRQEWEERVAQALEMAEDEDEEEEEPTGDTAECYEDDLQAEDDRSSTTSEYAFSGGGSGASLDPTPLASTPPIPAVSTLEKAFPIIPSAPQPPPPVSYAWQGISLQTRSSTPSSVSSPLALAAPIVASDSPGDSNPPHMDLNDSVTKTVRPRKSVQNLDTSQQMSPLNSPLELSGARRSHRRHSTINPILSPITQPILGGPISPRLPSATPLSRTMPTSIKDFEVIKPISKGAFGSVFLAKKKATGDYYAIKVLKKADMIAKNQITNVKAERMILMKQAESPFVAKLYFTFQSKENLYLVMEYLNGGDCAALIKSLGALPEEWAKNYVAEVVLGLDYLHQRGIIHRDLKPDNLLIDQHGHLKLTDFGLSRIGLLGRQTREAQLMPLERGGRATRTRYSPHSRPPSMDSAYLSSPLIPADLIGGGSYFNQQPASVYRQRTNSFLSSTDDVSESSGSDSFPNFFARRAGGQMNDSPLQSFATELTTDLRSHSSPGGSGTPPGEQKFVGTPDYLAPETILGLRGDDVAVDWWALGVITYEFLYGAPPFHDETPEKVFENILSRRIEWLEEYIDYSIEARDFMERLLTVDPIRRLGANGADEVKAHPWFAGIEWDKVTTTEAAFIPQVTDPESTDYFDPRGAILQLFEDDQPVPTMQSSLQQGSVGIDVPHSEAVPVPRGGRDATTPADDEFGTFSFKNLPVLKQANDDVIRKLRTDQMAPITHTLSESGVGHTRKRSMSAKKKVPSSVVTSFDAKSTITNPPSPATSTSSIASSPSRGSVPPSTPGSVAGHIRKPSEYGAVERFKQNYMDADVGRRNSMPSRLRTASVSSSMGDGSLSDAWPASIGHTSSHFEVNTPPSSVASIDLKKGPDPSDRAVTCLLAEDNPITAKIIETLLSRLGCRCVVVADGSEAISVALGDIKFDCILMDLHMPVVDGESAARYIKSTNNKNTSTPIIAVSAYSGADMGDASTLFTASLSKPLQKADLLAAMRELGFKTSTAHSSAPGKAKAITTR